MNSTTLAQKYDIKITFSKNINSSLHARYVDKESCKSAEFSCLKFNNLNFSSNHSRLAMDARFFILNEEEGIAIPTDELLSLSFNTCCYDFCFNSGKLYAEPDLRQVSGKRKEISRSTQLHKRTHVICNNVTDMIKQMSVEEQQHPMVHLLLKLQQSTKIVQQQLKAYNYVNEDSAQIIARTQNVAYITQNGHVRINAEISDKNHFFPIMGFIDDNITYDLEVSEEQFDRNPFMFEAPRIVNGTIFFPFRVPYRVAFENSVGSVPKLTLIPKMFNFTNTTVVGITFPKFEFNNYPHRWYGECMMRTIMTSYGAREVYLAKDQSKNYNYLPSFVQKIMQQYEFTDFHDMLHTFKQYFFTIEKHEDCVESKNLHVKSCELNCSNDRHNAYKQISSFKTFYFLVNDLQTPAKAKEMYDKIALGMVRMDSILFDNFVIDEFTFNPSMFDYEGHPEPNVYNSQLYKDEFLIYFKPNGFNTDRLHIELAKLNQSCLVVTNMMAFDIVPIQDAQENLIILYHHLLIIGLIIASQDLVLLFAVTLTNLIWCMI
jgi:hypothetical protein